MLGPLFSAIDVARERLDRMLDAAKIRVCSVVNTDVADCLLSRYGLAAKAGSGRKLLAWKRSFFALSEVGPLRDLNRQKIASSFLLPGSYLISRCVAFGWLEQMWAAKALSRSVS
jgi:hypothetical protein